VKIDIFTHVMLSRYKKAFYKYDDKLATEKTVKDRRPFWLIICQMQQKRRSRRDARRLLHL
jgi:hypothetical protein